MRQPRAGFTLLELLVALLLFAVGLSGLIGLWTFGFKMTDRSQDTGVAYNIARREVERAKNIGFLSLPLNLHRVQAYDGLGHETSAANPPFTATLDMDPGVNPGTITSASQRTLRVQVQSKELNQMIYDSTTYLTQGGI